MVIIAIIAFIANSIIIFGIEFLIALFFLIFSIYLYIKYEKEDKTTQTGNTITHNNLV